MTAVLTEDVVWVVLVGVRTASMGGGGPLLERYFLLALKKSDGDIMTLFSSNLGNVLWIALVVSLVAPAVLSWRRGRKKEQAQ